MHLFRFPPKANCEDEQDARAMFDHGRKAEAIKLERDAIAVCKDERTRSQLEATLKQYQGSASQ
jgi:hypothetical protein